MTQEERNFCHNLKVLRERRGLSQTALGERMAELGFKWHQTTVARVEEGRRTARLGEAVALSAILGVSNVTMIQRPKVNRLVEQLNELLDRYTEASEQIADAIAEWIELRAAMQDVLNKQVAEGISSVGRDHAVALLERGIDDLVSRGELAARRRHAEREVRQRFIEEDRRLQAGNIPQRKRYEAT